MLTREARAAVHAAEAASKAAQQAQAAFQYVLDGLEAATSAEPAWEPEPIPEHHGTPVVVPPPQKLTQRTTIHAQAAIAPAWELETDTQPDESGSYDDPSRYDRPSIMEAHISESGESAQPGELVQPIYANLIEFPREMIATRRARPRRAEGPLAEAESAPQLSIFEVDPAAISIEPAPATMDSAVAPTWMRPEWSAMTLEALPPTMDLEALPSTVDLRSDRASRGRLVDQFLEEPAPRTAPAHRNRACADEPATACHCGRLHVDRRSVGGSCHAGCVQRQRTARCARVGVWRRSRATGHRRRLSRMLHDPWPGPRPA